MSLPRSPTRIEHGQVIVGSVYQLVYVSRNRYPVLWRELREGAELALVIGSAVGCRIQWQLQFADPAPDELREVAEAILPDLTDEWLGVWGDYLQVGGLGFRRLRWIDAAGTTTGQPEG